MPGTNATGTEENEVIQPRSSIEENHHKSSHFLFVLFMQIKALVTQLEENQRQMNDALAVCKSAIEANDPSQASYFSLKIEPDFREAKRALDAKPVRNFVLLMLCCFPVRHVTQRAVDKDLSPSYDSESYTLDKCDDFNSVLIVI